MEVAQNANDAAKVSADTKTKASEGAKIVGDAVDAIHQVQVMGTSSAT